jgi:hypothetical protein
MGEAKRVAEASGKSLAERQQEMMEQAQRTGWAEFVSMLNADPSRSLDARIYKRALLGLGWKVDVIRDSAKTSFDAASEVAKQQQRQILALFARQEVMHRCAKAQKEATAKAFEQVVERQDADAAALSGFVIRLARWHDDVLKALGDHDAAMRGWRSLGWWVRRRTLPPSLELPEPPNPPGLHGPLTIALPAVPELPPLASAAELAALMEDAGLVPATKDEGAGQSSEAASQTGATDGPPTSTPRLVAALPAPGSPEGEPASAVMPSER